MNTIYLVLIVILLYVKAQSAQLPSGCLDAFRRSALITHNILRSKHGSPNLLEDPVLDASALTYANYLAVNDVFVHSKNLVNTGENLYVSYDTDGLTLAMCSRKKFKLEI